MSRDNRNNSTAYRDETETLRADLDRAHAELAELKSARREVDVIQWHDSSGRVQDWVVLYVVATLVFMVAISIIATIAEHYDYHRFALAMLALASASLAVSVWLWWRAIPRAKWTR